MTFRLGSCSEYHDPERRLNFILQNQSSYEKQMSDFRSKMFKILTAKSIHIEESSMKEIQCNKNFNVIQTISRDSNVKNSPLPLARHWRLQVTSKLSETETPLLCKCPTCDWLDLRRT